MKIHNLLSYTLILYISVMTASSPRELTLIETSSKTEQINHKRSPSTSEMYSRLSCYPTPRDSGYSNYNNIDMILMQHNPSASCFSQNGNTTDIQNQYQNSSMNNYYAVTIPDERTPKTAKFSKKTVVAFTFLGCLTICKLVADILELEEYYNHPHPNNDKPGTLFASLGMDITSLLLLGAVYKCNNNKF